MKVTVSIIICTRNRAESLRGTLESIGQVTVPPNWRVELIVVDNNSTDHTQSLIRATRLSNLEVRYVSERKPGVAYAKNKGIREAVGEIILCTDDDLRLPANWIEGICRPIVDGIADAVAGGVVFPPHVLEILRTSRLGEFQSWVASTAGINPTRPERMVGANMAFHRRVLEKIPLFDVELGPGALGFSEETLFSWQLLAAGYRIVSAFDVVVEHHFDTTRLTKEGVLDMARKMGRSHAFIFHHWEHQRSRLTVLRLIDSSIRRFLMSGLMEFGIGRGALWPALLRLEEAHAFIGEVLFQRKRRPKYDRHGLSALPLKPGELLTTPLTEACSPQSWPRA